MKTVKMTVTNNEVILADALAATENLGKEAGLDRKSLLHLRLLSEELFGMIRGIAGQIEADYTIEAEGKDFTVTMNSAIDLTDEMREQFISASSSGKNSAATGFMGKLRVMIAEMIFSAKENAPYAMMNTAAAYTAGSSYEGAAYVWTMTAYKDEVKKSMATGAGKNAEWDELEKSIVANIADDVKVSIVGRNVQISVYKSFN